MVRAAGAGRKNGKSLPVAATNETLTKIDPPPELRDDNARAIWVTQSQVLITRQILTIDHAPMLLAYCNSFSLMLEADVRINDEGLTVSSAKGGDKKHPVLNARNDAISSMVRIGSLLGLDPLSRQRMLGGGGGSSSPGHNEFDEFG